MDSLGRKPGWKPGIRITWTDMAGSYLSCVAVLAGGKRSDSVQGDAKCDGQTQQHAKTGGLVYRKNSKYWDIYV